MSRTTLSKRDNQQNQSRAITVLNYFEQNIKQIVKTNKTTNLLAHDLCVQFQKTFF